MSDAGDAKGPIDPIVGTTFGARWRVERALAAGGMGAVYVARDDAGGGAVALKLIKSARAGDQQLVARFRREMSALAAIHHDNVVKFLDSGLEERRTPDGRNDDALYLVMALLDGRSLRALWDAAPAHRIDWPRAFALIADVCAGLAALHARGIVHRDLKPENVLVTDPSPGGPQRAVLIDLGIVRLEEHADSALLDVTGAMTQTGFVVGTPGFIAPEQLLGRPATAASDVYAAGVILFELLTGRQPYEGANIEEVLRAQVLDDATRVRAIAPWLPEHVDALLARMLAREPAQRIASAQEARALLVDALDAQAPTETFTATALPAFPAATPSTPSATMQPVLQPMLQPIVQPMLQPVVERTTASVSSTTSLVTSVPPAPPRRGRVGAFAAVAVVAAVAAVVAVVVVPFLGGGPAPTGASIADAGVHAPAPRTGTLHVDVTPAVDVFVDHKPVGRTDAPLVLDVEPGSHVVQLARDGDVVLERSVDVVAGEAVRLVDDDLAGARLPARATPTVTPGTLRALVRRKAPELAASCKGPAMATSGTVTAYPDGRVQLVVEGPHRACVGALSARWKVDRFVGAPVATRVDVTLGE
jgi:serine/threonine protein kinase